ncbi:MAG: hypothetical protein RR942_06445 [Romboutsia sp.]
MKNENHNKMEKISDLLENINRFITYINYWMELEVDYNTNVLLNDIVCKLIPLEFEIRKIKNKFIYDTHIDKKQINKSIDEVIAELNDIKKMIK